MKKILVSLLQKVGRIAFPADPHAVRDIRLELQKIATHNTALYVSKNMRNVNSVSTREELHDQAIAAATIEGLVLEFGVFSGNSINYIADCKQNCTVHGFDSFEGLPEFWRDGFGKGHFSTGLPEVRSNVDLHKGWFDQSIPKFLEFIDNSADLPISYLHIDCDLYSSTKTIFEHLGFMMVSGTVIVFDEYFNYHGWEDGEFKAFQEFIEERKLDYRYISYNRRRQEVAVLLEAR